MVRKAISIGTVGCLVALAVVGLAIAQQGPQGQGRGERGQRPGADRPMRGDFDPEAMQQRMQQMMEQRMQEQLGATDEEWTVIGPRLRKVMERSRQTGVGMGGMRMGMGMRPDIGRRGARQDALAGRGARGTFAQGEPTKVEERAEELVTALENSDATPNEIEAKLNALRSAKEEARAQLATAQQELKKVLTLRQEAQLVLMGMLN